MTPWRIRNLLIEPYRVFFATGALYAAGAMAVWAAWLLAPGAIHLPWAVPPTLVHAHVMIYAVVGFYVFGFLLTAFPRWVNQPSVSRRQLVTIHGALVLGQLALFLGVFWRPGWMVAAAVLELAAYGMLLGCLIARYRAYCRAPGLGKDTSQPRYVLLALATGAGGIVCFYLGLLFPQVSELTLASVEFGVYGYLLLLVISITYRIVPFFAGRVIEDYTPVRGRHTLGLAALLIVIRMASAAALNDLPGHWLLAWSADLLLLGLLLREWRGWFARGVPRVLMLAVLFIGFFWIITFLSFSGYELVATLLSHRLPLGPIFRTPALHAILVGAFGTLLLAISTRVVRGHGGLPITADAFVGIPILLIQVATIARVFIPLVPSAIPNMTLVYGAGILWTTAFAIWSWRYLPLLGKTT